MKDYLPHYRRFMGIPADRGLNPRWLGNLLSTLARHGQIQREEVKAGRSGKYLIPSSRFPALG